MTKEDLMMGHEPTEVVVVIVLLSVFLTIIVGSFFYDWGYGRRSGFVPKVDESRCALSREETK